MLMVKIRRNSRKRLFDKVVVGGTFDKLHKGHKTLLLKAFETSKYVLIGICTDQFVKTLQKPHETAPFKERLADLKAFLTKYRYEKRSKIIPLNNFYGITLSNRNIDALIVSEETEIIAYKINDKREELKLPKIEVIVVEMIEAEINGLISTTRIRSGEIDREGKKNKTEKLR